METKEAIRARVCLADDCETACVRYFQIGASLVLNLCHEFSVQRQWSRVRSHVMVGSFVAGATNTIK
jgi:hypothetical protein